MTASQLRPLSQRHKLSRAQSESQWSMLKLIMKGHLLSKEAILSEATYADLSPLAISMAVSDSLPNCVKVSSTSKSTSIASFFA